MLISLKYIIKINLFFFFSNYSKWGTHVLPLGEEVLAPTSNGHGRIVNLRCLLLLPSIKMGESST
jgi:hypothetical protein